MNRCLLLLVALGCGASGAGAALAEARPPTQIAFTEAVDLAASELPAWDPVMEVERRAQGSDYKAAVAERARHLCIAVPDAPIGGWRAVVRYVRRSRLRDTVALNLRVSGIADIVPAGHWLDLSVFPIAAELQAGDLVVLDGSFLRSHTDCLRENSSSDLNSLRGPIFTVRITRIDRVIPWPDTRVDAAFITQLSSDAQFGWHCGMRFAMPHELEVGFGRAVATLPETERAAANAAWGDGKASGTTLGTYHPELCGTVTRNFVERLYQLVYGGGSLLHP